MMTDEHAGGYDEESLRRVRARMRRIDQMPRDLREMVHEFGLTIVDAFMQCGVTKPKHMRHLIQTIRAGSCEIGNRTGQAGRKA